MTAAPGSSGPLGHSEPSGDAGQPSPSGQPLSSLTVGTSGTVTEIRIPAEHRGRLLEMGLLVGTPVQLIRFAPLGDPIEIKVRGYHLTLRKHEAEQILVKPRA